MHFDNWSKEGSQTTFTCGYCGATVGSAVSLKKQGSATLCFLVECPACGRPMYSENGRWTPGVSYGNAVGHVPTPILDLFNEARRCMSVSAYTSAVLACRKLLMNVSVSHGAKDGQSFVFYVDYLSTNHFVPPTGKAWVDHIRKKGNEATHEIHPATEDDAKTLIDFAEMLLKLTYEFPNRAPKA